MALTIQNSLSINAYNPFIYATDAWTNLKSISFDGVDEYVDLNEVSILDNVSNYTISMWIKSTSLASTAVTIGRKTNDNSTNFSVYVATDGSFHNSIGAAAGNTAASAITINTWHHVVATYNGGAAAANRIQLYVDGVSSLDSVTGTIPIYTNSDTFKHYLGGRSNSNTMDLPFTGNIDEVGLFSYTLTSGEVTALYNSGCPNNLMSLSASKRPKHYYRFDDITYPTVDDLGETGGNNGTMTNAESTDIIEATPCWSPYIVDTYSPVVAYSFDQISSTATNVVRLRRDSDSAESDFTALDLTDGTALAWSPSQYSRVVKWYNQGTGGSTYDFVQTVATDQVVLISNTNVFVTRNGKPSMLFQGVGNPQRHLKCANTPFGQVSNSFFAVSSARGTSTIGTVMSLSDTLAQSLRIFQDTRTTPTRNLVVTNTGNTSYYADMSTARTAVDTLTLLSSFVDASKGMSGFDNGVTGGTDTFTGTWTNDAMQLGRQSTGLTYLDGTISEFIGFATDEISNRTGIETNINDRYSIY